MNEEGYARLPLNCQQKATASCLFPATLQIVKIWLLICHFYCSDMDGMGSPDGMMDHSMMDLKGGMGSPYSCYSSPKLPYDSFSNRGGLEYHLSWLLICSSRWFEPEPDEDGVAVAPEPARGRLRVQLRAISPLWPPLLSLAHRRRPVSSQWKFILRWKSLQLPWPWSSRDHEVKPSLVFHIVLLQRSFGTCVNGKQCNDLNKRGRF